MPLIKKHEVSQGVYWIEIEEIDLRILCSSPSDSVKHLMKQGFIQTVQQNNISFETGPNAILLSDIPIQNGKLSNLSEFPILQMLYRQGMSIPHHINNRGKKPILIGSFGQVQSQLNYIYRGNYGLVSYEELEETGLSDSIIHEIMRMKLHFAFGEIKSIDSFLETCIVSNKESEIKQGLIINRINLNQFKLTYKSEEVVVDLNVYKNHYIPPYSLKHVSVERDYFSVVYSGQGDGWNISEPSMCSIIIFKGKVYLVDACPHLEEILNALGIGVDEIEGVFHTHAHDDHFSGLITLLKSSKPIKYYATALVRHSVSKKFFSLLDLDESEFTTFFDPLDLPFDEWSNIDGLEVQPILSPHPIENNMFMFRTYYGGDYKSYAHFADLTSMDVLESMVTSEDRPGISHERYLKTQKEYLQYADIKKIDVGGGMIHGNIKDFDSDTSKKIIPSHLSVLDDTLDQNLLKPMVSFGDQDSLIKENNDFLMTRVYNYLDIPLTREYDELKRFSIEVLLPNSKFLEENSSVDSVSLVLSGNVVLSSSQYNQRQVLSAPIILGDHSILTDQPLRYMAVSKSYIRIMRIPKLIYLRLTKKTNVQPIVQQQWLFYTKLLNENIRDTQKKEIVGSIEEHFYRENQIIQTDPNRSYILKQGQIARYIDSEPIDILSNNDFFNIPMSISYVPSPFKFKAQTDCVVVSISHNTLKHIPIVNWKMLEHNKKSQALIFNSISYKKSSFSWKKDYSINIQTIDRQHQQILYILHNLHVYDPIENREEVILNLSVLKRRLEEHFQFEKDLLKKYHYCHNHDTTHDHQVVLDKIVALLDDLQDHIFYCKKSENHFFLSWIIEHIQTESRYYTHYLNNKNIF